MLDSDREEFARLLPAYVGKGADDGTLRRWWYALRPYNFADIKRAFVERDRNSSAYPQPHNIIETIRSLNGRPVDGAGYVHRYWARSDLLCATRAPNAYDANVTAAVEAARARRPDLCVEDAMRDWLGSAEYRPVRMA